MNNLIMILYANILKFKKIIISYLSLKDLRFYKTIFCFSVCSLSLVFLLNGDDSDCLMIKDILYPEFEKSMSIMLKKHFDECSQIESYFIKFESTRKVWFIIFGMFFDWTYTFEISEELMEEFIRKKKK